MPAGEAAQGSRRGSASASHLQSRPEGKALA